MKKTTSPTAVENAPIADASRFAHQFFNIQKPDERKSVKGIKRMTDVIVTKLEAIPKVKGDSVMRLQDIIGDTGTKQIEAQKSISFHAVGDTGHENGNEQEMVADAMTGDYDITKPAKSPAFFLHLGDVIYYDNTDKGYHAQFYVPYKKYPGKIIAIPGNHDGELFKWDKSSTGQAKTLEAFQNNFCKTGAASVINSGTILRNMVSQPGVYWMLDAPFVNIIGLYSNIAENPGYIQAGKIGTAQKTWLTKTLAAIKKQRDAGHSKALIIAVHHPPISKGNHSSSTQMLADIDDSCNKSGIMPNAVLAAHAHDYQRFTRYVTFNGKNMEIPFIVAGSGGRGLSPHLTPATGAKEGDHIYNSSLKGYGYLKVNVSATSLKLEFYSVNGTTGAKKLFDKVAVNLKTNKAK